MDIVIRNPPIEHVDGLIPLQLGPISWEAIITLVEDFGSGELVVAAAKELRRQLDAVKELAEELPVGLRFEPVVARKKKE